VSNPLAADPPQDLPMTEAESSAEAAERRFRSTLIKVLAVQAVALALLGLLQLLYG
jgi:hypothetical protein